jgi:putative endonuclease
MDKRYTLYILLCGNGQYYTGITSNLGTRLRTHQLTNKETSHYKQWTKFRQPVHLVFKYDGLENLEVALKVERYIKTWRKSYKQNLIHGNTFALNLLKQCHWKSMEEFIKLNNALHWPQTRYPCIVHTQM